MAYKTGSITRFIMPANLTMCVTAAATVFFFVNQDYLAGWIALLITLLILIGIPGYTKRILDNTLLLIRSYNDTDSAIDLHIPGFADELQALNQELGYLQKIIIRTRDTNALSVLLMNNIVEHFPFAIIVYEDTGKVLYTNVLCQKILGTRHEYITAYPHEYQNIISAWKNIPDQQQIVFSVPDNSDNQELLISKNKFSLNNTTCFLVSMKSIKSELDSKEMASWQKLIRVLNHEIMNSLTPISSLSQAMIPKISAASNDKDQETVKKSLDLIARRSKNLMSFVQKFRQLALLPVPELKIIPLNQLINDTMLFFEPEFCSRQITPRIIMPEPAVQILADQSLLQQVFINLIKNSLEALKDVAAPSLQLSAVCSQGITIIKLTDNGHGIAPSAQQNIFIPFFTTKTGGSGIGLALSRQIIRSHKGEITLSSIPNLETTFQITLPQILS
ncbi:MAG: HAMP domain-containing histidine kinase [Candidatus Cloacimonetes bacterium]|nr:HAMP domain-containing histidine kinase [Candidatus Cloacimonadota bacterium]